MKVKELIELLQKCNPEDIVFYDAGNGFDNKSMNVFTTDPENYGEDMDIFGIDDVLIGAGTLRGHVYMTEDKMKEDVG